MKTAKTSITEQKNNITETFHMTILDRGKKRIGLEQALKHSILTGELSPGTRLPTLEQLNLEFNASKATFQHVINRLKKQGFIRSVERQGMFVADHLPCETHFGLVFDRKTNAFLKKIEEQADFLNQEGRWQFSVFRNEYSPALLERNWNTLRERLQERTLAGLFFFFNPVDEEILQLIREFSEVPMLMYDYYPDHETLLVLKMEPESCAEKSLSLFLERGITRLAVICKPDQPLTTSFRNAARKKGIEIPDRWCLPAPEYSSEGARNIVMLLLSLPPEQRPRGLYLTDDNLLNAVQAGIVESGVRVPQDLTVVCHTNFPDPPETVIPVPKVGFDNRELLRRSIEAVREFRRTGRVRHNVIQGKYETEIESVNHFRVQRERKERGFQ